ncbi:MAG: DNA integrity scanning protein DisA nucleotide-binding domain protein [Deltaproteobacteria bacterium]|nr:DNA integrity scanning protein DisA nucleotide-binding domain protein [Deltaproteobacteria bacterium]
MLNFFQFPTLRDLADIVFLTIVAYQLYIWFRETKALRVIIGLVVLGGVYSLAKLWGLFMTTWVFQVLWQVLIILLLILFQSEIRQVLEKVSPLRYFRSRKRFSSEAFLNDLIITSFELAQEKTGALIVISRDDNLSEFIHSGQKIMAIPEPALIKSIFNRYAPTHDGAVIVSQDLLTEMGCILPLSEKEALPEHFGTRHRAALGITELTDAVCIVVSEERAEVSTVVHGKVTTRDKPELLAADLRNLLAAPKTDKPTLKGFLAGAFIENWKTKIRVLMLVTAAWLVVASQQVTQINIAVPVNYTNIVSSMVVAENSVKMANLTLTGKRHTMKDLEGQEVQIQVDLSTLEQGKHKLELTPKHIDLPLGVTIGRINPKEVTVFLELADKAGDTAEYF